MVPRHIAGGEGSDLTDYQALAWITSVLRRAAFRIERAERQRAAKEPPILDAPVYPGDAASGGGLWSDRLVDAGPSVEDVVEADVDVDLFARILSPREAQLVRLFAND